MNDLEVVRVSRTGEVLASLGEIVFDGVPRVGDLVATSRLWEVVAVAWMRRPLGAGLEPVLYVRPWHPFARRLSDGT